MADVPEVGITNGVPVSGTGTVQTLSTVNDKLVILSDALGAAAGTKIVTDDDGTIQQYLRGRVTQWADATGAGTAAAALRTVAASDDPAVAALALVNSILGETDSDSAGLTTTDLLDGSQAINAAQLLRFCAEYLKDLKTNSDLEAAATDAVPVVGDTAHDAADSGNPVGVGLQARTTNPTAVADGDRVRAIADKLGKQVVVGSLRTMKVKQTTALTAITTEQTILTAGAAGVFHDLYGLIITNTSAIAVASVTIRDVTAGSAIAFFAVPAGETRGFMLPESGGIPQTTAASAWTAQSGTSVSSLRITALAVKNL